MELSVLQELAYLALTGVMKMTQQLQWSSFWVSLLFM